MSTKLLSDALSDEAPKLDMAWVEGADLMIGTKVVRRGRPPSLAEDRREAISLRVPVYVLERFRASGDGWQTRMVDVLSAAAETTPKVSVFRELAQTLARSHVAERSPAGKATVWKPRKGTTA